MVCADPRVEPAIEAVFASRGIGGEPPETIAELPTYPRQRTKMMEIEASVVKLGGSGKPSRNSVVYGQPCINTNATTSMSSSPSFRPIDNAIQGVPFGDVRNDNPGYNRCRNMESKGCCVRYMFVGLLEAT